MQGAGLTIEGNAERVPLIAALGLLPFIEKHLWIVDHLDDVLSDLSVFHGIRSIEEVESGRFFTLADRLVHYRGAVRGHAELEAERAEEDKRHGRDARPTTNDDLAAAAAAGEVEWS